MLSKLEKQAVFSRVENDLVEVFTRARDLKVSLKLIESSSCSYLSVCDDDIDEMTLARIDRAMFCFIGSFGVMQLLFSVRRSDFIRDVCKRHGFELVEGGC